MDRYEIVYITGFNSSEGIWGVLDTAFDDIVYEGTRRECEQELERLYEQMASERRYAQ